MPVKLLFTETNGQIRANEAAPSAALKRSRTAAAAAAAAALAAIWALDGCVAQQHVSVTSDARRTRAF